jgi:hypothetical protein
MNARDGVDRRQGQLATVIHPITTTSSSRQLSDLHHTHVVHIHQQADSNYVLLITEVCQSFLA